MIKSSRLESSKIEKSFQKKLRKWGEVFKFGEMKNFENKKNK